MEEPIAVSAHAAPWQPTSDSELVEAYDVYDVPLVGHLRQHGQDYVFWCVEGVTSDLSLWAYASVDAEDVMELDRSADFDSTFARVTAEKALVLAVYEEQRGIIGLLSVDHPRSFDSLTEAARSEFGELTRRMAGQPAST